jgi:hypothetical protein
MKDSMKVRIRRYTRAHTHASVGDLGLAPYACLVIYICMR